MALITATMLDLNRVAPEMIGRAHKCFDGQGKPYYMVESSEFDGDEMRVEYSVTWDREKGFACTCQSGQEAFRSCGAKKVCDHVLISLAAAKEEKEALKALNEKIVKQPVKREHYIASNGKEVSDEVYKRILNAKGQDTKARVSRETLNGNRPFSLMR
jgi:hypothetical protein